MRALFLKEFRQGRALLIFALSAALLLAAGHAVLGRALAHRLYGEPSPSDLTIAFGVLVLATPLLLAVFAGSGLFAGEAEHNTVPVLFALPLSRRRIWLAKVLGGLALTVVGSGVVLGLSALLLRGPYGSLPVTSYLPDLCFSALFVYAGAALLSSLTSNFIAALVGSLLVGGGMGLGLGLLWSQLGALLFGYSYALEVAIWLFLSAPCLLLASGLAITRGERLESLRRHAFAIPALVAGLVVTVALVSGAVRLATRYSRAGVKAIAAPANHSGSPVVALLTHGGRVAWERSAGESATAPEGLVGVSWRRRAARWEWGQMGDFHRGPFYRENYGVVLDLRTGRELAAVRATGHRFRLSCSPDGRFAAFARGPDGLTWGPQPWRDRPEKLEIVELGTGRRLYSDVPAPLRERRYLHITELQWSPRGEYLAFSSAPSYPWSSAGLGLYVMRPDGSSLQDLAAKPAVGEWAWSRAGEVIYALDRGRLYRLHLDGRAPEAVWSWETAESRTKLSMLEPGLSPDGRWIVVRVTEESTEEVVRRPRVGQHFTETVRVVAGEAAFAVRADGSEQVVLWARSAPPGPPGPGQALPPQGTQVAWSPDGRALFALIWEAGDRARPYRWRPGEAAAAPIGPELTYGFARLIAGPGPDEVLIWPGHSPRPADGPRLADTAGRVRPVLSEEFAAENELVSLDDAGRLITISRSADPQVVFATDLRTGESERVYP